MRNGQTPSGFSCRSAHGKDEHDGKRELYKPKLILGILVLSCAAVVREHEFVVLNDLGLAIAPLEPSLTSWSISSLSSDSAFQIS